MKLFKLPDLGEGLPDAEIREWYVKVGYTVKVDQPLVAMETAKALVDVPAPFDGKIEKLFGNVGDIIKTDAPLIGFMGAEENHHLRKDSVTVVGAIEESETLLQETASTISSQKKNTHKTRFKATPSVRMLARKLGVDLSTVIPKGEIITAKDVKKSANKMTQVSASSHELLTGNFIELSQVRRAMALSMTQSHQKVVPVTLVDDADLSAWQTKQDMTVRLIRAIQIALIHEKIINAYFDFEKMVFQFNEFINIGMAVDTAYGLYVPVLKDVAHQEDARLRANINRFKEQAKEHRIAQEDLQGATFVLSNFGVLSGRYANPVIIPPMVAILGVGKARYEVVPEAGKPALHLILPLSITIDHRAVTGGEAARFLKRIIDELKKEN